MHLTIPAGQPRGSRSYLQYPGGQLLSQPNGTLEFWTYLTSYEAAISIAQGPFYGACSGWTGGLSVGPTGQLQASAWAAFSLTSGTAIVPLNTWTHVALTWGSTGAKLYLNGVLVGTDANTGMPASGYGGSVLVNSGAGTGQLDELRISNVQRTSFNLPAAIVPLTLRTTGGGTGRVAATPAGPLYAPGTVVTLTAVATAGSRSSWKRPTGLCFSPRWRRPAPKSGNIATKGDGIATKARRTVGNVGGIREPQILSTCRRVPPSTCPSLAHVGGHPCGGT